MTPPSEAPAGQAIEAARLLIEALECEDQPLSEVQQAVRLVCNAFLSLHAQNERMREALEWERKRLRTLGRSTNAIDQALEDQP